jgi:outer membrane biosynthesis protein TonB
MANIAKLLMLQGGKCFYCGNKLSLEDATLDHVLAKALGGDNSEANTVACCHSINHAFGNATPKEKPTAIIIAGGRIDCPPKPTKKTVSVAAELPADEPKQVESPPAPQPKPQPVKKAAAKTALPKQTNQKPAPEKKPSELRKPLQEAFKDAAAINGGEKVLLTIVSIGLRKKIPNFVVKHYGEKTFAKLVTVLGYQVDKDWCYPKK